MNTDERKAVGIMMSPCKIYILNTLFDSSEGLSVSTLRAKMNENLPRMSNHLEVHLNELFRQRILESREGGYALSEQGKRIYEKMEDLVNRIEIPA